uniref:1-acylglycerol-3-phosphate O-acyltransferase n=1 Tax=Varanus komodoensis TaxID=61221 RepID=A0A8D2LPI1_VARKO
FTLIYILFIYLFKTFLFISCCMNTPNKYLYGVLLFPHKPASPAPRPSSLHRILCLCILPLKYFYGLRLTVQGSENLNIKEPYMIVSNHQSYLDLLGMMEVLPDRCIAFALLYMGPVGLSCWCCNFIFIDRKKRTSPPLLFSLPLLVQLRVWVYLEGTRNPKDTMLPFKREAFHLAVKTQVNLPIVNIKSVEGAGAQFYCWNWTSRILPRIETQGLGPKDVPELAENVCKTMQETFDEISSEVYGKKKVKE